MNPVSQSPSEIESSSTVSSEASRWSEDETPTISDDEFIVSDSEIAEAEAEESEEDDIELLYESFVNLREENKLFKEELAKQNNLLWEIYEELKENQRSEAVFWNHEYEWKTFIFSDAPSCQVDIWRPITIDIVANAW